jgi:serine protease Do
MGDVVLAIGNPFGLSHTVTMGIVSATGRANVGIADYEDFIQTDAAINPGNSGGALVNMKGELVGINTAIVSRTGGYQGIGFAIPTNMAQSVMVSLVQYGKVTRGWLGVTIQDINQDLAEAMNLKTIKGALISDVINGSPADEAGLKQGDVIVEVDGKEVESTGKLRNMIATLGAGAQVNLSIIRDGEKVKIELTLDELSARISRAGQAEIEKGALGGLTLVPLSPSVAKQFEIPSSVHHGVVVTGIQPGGAGHMSGLRTGDVIQEINRRKVNSVEAFRKAYESTRDRVLLLINRKGNAFYLVLRK